MTASVIDQRAAAWLDIIQAWRSVRRYEAEPLAPELIDRLLRSASWALSAHNRQPWRFAVIETFARKDRLTRARGHGCAQDRRGVSYRRCGRVQGCVDRAFKPAQQRHRALIGGGKNLHQDHADDSPSRIDPEIDVGKARPGEGSRRR